MKTTSYELSKQLKEAGFDQESYFDWEIGTDDKPHLVKSVIERHGDEYRLFTAPTAEEVLERLPYKTKIPTQFDLKEWEYWKLHIDNANGKWNVQYICGGPGSDHVDVVQGFTAESLAEAAGKMYLFLAENHLLKEDSIEAKKEVGATSEVRPHPTGKDKE